MYAKPLEVWDALDLTKNRSEEFPNTDGGTTLNLENNYLIQDAFDVSGSKQDVEVLISGTVQSTSDYDVDLRDGKVTWNGSDGSDLKIRYKTAPVPNSTCVEELESASQTIDRKTNTTFDGTETVTEIYDWEKGAEELVLFNRPVQSLVSVDVNEARPGESDDFTNLTKGRENDVWLADNLSIRFTSPWDITSGKSKIKVEYEYGYSNVPNDIQKAARMLAQKSLLQNNVVGETVDGRDDFNPGQAPNFISDIDDLLNGWTQMRMGEQPPLKV